MLGRLSTVQMYSMVNQKVMMVIRGKAYTVKKVGILHPKELVANWVATISLGALGNYMT